MPSYQAQHQAAASKMRHKHQHQHRRRQQRDQTQIGPPALAFPSASPNLVPQLDAVIFRNLTYEIGRGRQRKTILNKINLTVPEGSIYGLLGPSGCGKTTMLRCMVGRVRPQSGSVMVFGLRPGESPSEVPGRHVGYMPQEISVYEDFTIEETLNYFGLINRMPMRDIKKRVDFLLQFLDLPTKKRTVSNLSGGQKRRVSLAAALVHSPPLLILDEPTVGVDPLLRHSIWQHLVAMTKQERISVIITTHYIEEARQANVVGLMRNGRILAEDSPDELMHRNGLTNLEDVFLKLCMSDSSRRAARMATGNQTSRREAASEIAQVNDMAAEFRKRGVGMQGRKMAAAAAATTSVEIGADREGSSSRRRQIATFSGKKVTVPGAGAAAAATTVRINTGTNEIQQVLTPSSFVIDEAVEDFSSEDEATMAGQTQIHFGAHAETTLPLPLPRNQVTGASPMSDDEGDESSLDGESCASESEAMERYMAAQHMHWAARRAANAQNLLQARSRAHALATGPYMGLDGRKSVSSRALTPRSPSSGRFTADNESGFCQWWKTLMAVTWKNYTRLRRNPPVLVFQFVLPAIQVILFCLCIGNEPFDVPVAVVNEELVPVASAQFLENVNNKTLRQIRYDNLTSAIEAARRGHVLGVIHIPKGYTTSFTDRLVHGENATSETITNGTITVYPDLTNIHLAMTLQDTLRESFFEFAKDSIENLGYDRSLGDLPIQTGKPIYGTLNKDSYLEFMAPGVVISITYVMATGLTALAFILERRDGLLERSLVSGVQTSQILLAHSINQVCVMSLQILLSLSVIFFIFEIPSHGPVIWVVVLILLQGSTGMSFGLLVSSICKEENTAVMMVVGTFYTNLILAGIIWPIEAMPLWIRPLSYAQPQTLATESMRDILSRGWGISEPGVLLGFGVTVGWLVAFLITAGAIFKYASH